MEPELIKHKLLQSLMPQRMGQQPPLPGPTLQIQPMPQPGPGGAMPQGYDQNGMLRGQWPFHDPDITDEQWYNGSQEARRHRETPI